MLAATLGRGHPDYEKACLSLADALAKLGRPDEAETLLRETLEITRSHGDPAATCIPGHSAYDEAVHLGLFTGTPAEFVT